MPDARPTPEQLTADDVSMAFALEQIARIGGVLHALLFTSDGLALARSGQLDLNTGDRTAAAMAGLQSLSTAMAPFCEAEPKDLTLRHVTVDYGSHTVFVLGAGERTGLAVAVRGGSTEDAAHAALSTALNVAHRLRLALEARERSGTPAP